MIIRNSFIYMIFLLYTGLLLFLSCSPIQFLSDLEEMVTQDPQPDSTPDISDRPTLAPTPIPTTDLSPEPSPDLTPESTPIPGDLIINMVCIDSVNAANWSVRTNIQEGDDLYGDRVYTISTLPPSYAGSDWIRTACESKHYFGYPLVTFTVTRDAYVYVVHDDRADLPGWLSSWTDTTDNLIDSQPVNFTIYSKLYTANSQVSLGNNGSNDSCAGYSIIVKDSGEPTPEPTPGNETGQILRQKWENLSDEDQVVTLTSLSAYPDSPDSSGYLTSFEAPGDDGEAFGCRVIGYLHPLVSGNYTFWVASNNEGELWLSTDSSESNKQLIAFVIGWTDEREWDKYSSQESTSINLNAGSVYFIEAIMREGHGTDNLAVAWQPPGGSREVIPGTYLSPYNP